MSFRYPLIRPNPPRLSESIDELLVVEQSGIFSNYGPEVRRFEEDIVRELFQSVGASLTFNNATIGLMTTLKYLTTLDPRFPKAKERRYVVMPSFTFAATAHAAKWCGLEPLFCDIESETFHLCTKQLRSILEARAGDIAAIIGYPTFGNPLSLAVYEEIQEKYQIPVMIDAAASLGSLTNEGFQFGFGSNLPIVFSMHVTKLFSTSEGGLIYWTNGDGIETLRQMGNFGFNAAKEAILPGLNSKLSEVAAVLCRKKLPELPEIIAHKNKVIGHYRGTLQNVRFQHAPHGQPAYSVLPVLINRDDVAIDYRAEVVEGLAKSGIQAGTYFNPPMHRNQYFSTCGCPLKMTNTDAISSSIIHLPLYDDMSLNDVEYICEKFNALTEWQKKVA